MPAKYYRLKIGVPGDIFDDFTSILHMYACDKPFLSPRDTIKSNKFKCMHIKTFL